MLPYAISEMFMTPKQAANQVVIRKYANRRLYDTNASRYVTIDDLKLMVKNSLDAVVKADPDLARQVREEDDVVDAGRQAVRKLVMQQIKKDPEKVESLLQINSVSKHLERIADMATNIAEDVIYMVEGEIVRHRRRDDMKST